MLAEPVFLCSSLLSPTGILSLSIRYNNLFAGKTNTPFFLLWRGLMESWFNNNYFLFFWLCEPLGGHVLR